MPEVTGGWPEEGAQQYAPGAPMEPVQQAYPPQQPYQTQQQYQQQGYPEQQYHQQQAQQQYPAPQQAQQQYPQEQTVPQQALFVEEEQSALPSEFDHLFRDSSPEDRRAISGKQPMVSGPGASPALGFPQAQQQQMQPAQPAQATQQAPAATAMYSQQPQDYVPQTQSVDYGNGPFSYDGPPGGGGSGNRRTPLIIGGAVAVIAVIGLYLGLSGGGGGGKANTGATTTATASAASNETAQQEADNLYALVKNAKQLRSDINAGVGKLRDCQISAAQSQIQSTAQARQSAATQVAALPVDKISGGSSLVSALQKAWQDSADSDNNYLKAAQDFTNGGCSKGAVEKDSYYQAAQNGSGTSASDKSKAADLWNSVTSKYNEPSITGSDL